MANIFTMLRNRFLQILHKNINLRNLDEETKKKVIDRILKDVENDVFAEEEEMELDWLYQTERTSDIIFSNVSTEKKVNALRQSRKENGVVESLSSEERIRKKQKELGIIYRTVKKYVFTNGKKRKDYYVQGRFGRSPLHEAIIMKDMKSIRKYVKQELYLFHVDNNNHTALQLARYEEYEPAIKILEKTKKKRK